MTTETTLNDKLRVVAEFMGYTERPEHNVSENYIWFENENGNGKYNISFKYHTDWNELHRVWDKFRDLPGDTPDGLNYALHEMVVKEMILRYNTPDNAFEALYTAITWYNSIKP